MIVFNEKAQLNLFLNKNIKNDQLTGFVPTMGALHEGHLSLIKQSVNENFLTIVSVFVNPTQFNNLEDLEKYPRTLDTDVKKIETLKGNIIVYAPEVKDLYEDETVSEEFNFDGLEHEMEGKHRKGHFDGVGTIVGKLFNIVKPNTSYFGEKDFQQLQIIKKLNTKYNFNIKIVGCPTYREDNGLAMSSRNERLSSFARNEAAIIYQSLQKTAELFPKKSITELQKIVENSFNKHPLFDLEYFEIAEETTLKSAIRKNKTKKYRAFIAVYVENIRLIDNIALN